MTILLPTLAISFAAFCVWLTVRIVNRRERWAKWTLAGIVGMPVLYVASFGPACWISSRMNTDSEAEAPMISVVYRPVTLTFSKATFAKGPALSKFDVALLNYAKLFAKRGWLWMSIVEYDAVTRNETVGPWEWRSSPPPNGLPPMGPAGRSGNPGLRLVQTR